MTTGKTEMIMFFRLRETKAIIQFFLRQETIYLLHPDEFLSTF